MSNDFKTGVDAHNVTIGGAMQGSLTIISSRKPAVLGKIFRLTADGLEKTTAGQMVEGSFEVHHFDSADALATLVASVGTNQAFTSSLPKNGAESGEIVTADEQANHPGALARTKADFGLPSGKAGILVLDYDPSGEPLSRDQLWAALREVCPAVAGGDVVWWCSGSSYIFNGTDQLQGLCGQRLYLAIADLSDTVRFSETLAKRFWLAGHGRIQISTAGSLLVRSLFDEAMAQPARLDFVGGAVCRDPLVQRRGSPVVLSRGGFLDTRAALPDLTAAEQAGYEDAVDAAKRSVELEAARVRAAWLAARKPEMVQRLMRSGVAAADAEERAERTLSAGMGGTLLGDFEITLDGGKLVTVGEILDNRERYHGGLSRDPLEPEYQGGKVCGKLYLYGSAAVLTSRAHGGRTFRLLRQPARLCVSRGRKAELVSELVDRLGQEPDVFVSGGVLVRVEGGAVKPLVRHALLHLLGSRFAFFTKNEKGVESPIDPSPDVADMLLAVAQ